MKKVLVTDPIAESGYAILEKAGFDVLDYAHSAREEWMSVLPEVHGWVIRSGSKPDEEALNKAANLEIIGRAGVGVDNIDIPTATRLGIIVMNTPAVNTISAAEHTVGMILAVSRHLAQGHESLNQGHWNRHALVGTELFGKTLGIVGCGKIGCEVRKRFSAFGMNMIGYDPFLTQKDFNINELKMVDLDTLTQESDFISLHVPLVNETKYLFNLDRFNMMKPTARIINVARGGIIHENDLATALNQNIIAGAGMDVFEKEPIDENHPLLNIPNCILTPHLGASTLEAKEGVSLAVCNQVRDYLIDKKMTYALNNPFEKK
ncbi:MAG: hydroxyacid dehydrogenase [Candidatus Marinimicrobia bacterium]|nr:hydroxyacid dehydrogenase [Candidatus Neomarinimicrobiota bacterium]